MKTVNRLHEGNGRKLDIPEGGRFLSDEIVMYSTKAGHRYLYLPTMEWMKGLTTYLNGLPKPYPLIKWMADHGSYEKYQAEMKRLAMIGTEVHQAIQDLLTRSVQKISRKEMSPEAYERMLVFKTWHDIYKPIVEAIEEPVIDPERGVATQIDFRGGVIPPIKRGAKETRERLHTVLNWKTSKSVFDSAKIQSSVEGQLYNECMEHDEHGPVEQVGVVALNNQYTKAGFTYWSLDLNDPQQKAEYDVNLELFEHVRQVENLMNPEMKPDFGKPKPPEIELPEY